MEGVKIYGEAYGGEPVPTKAYLELLRVSDPYATNSDDRDMGKYVV